MYLCASVCVKECFFPSTSGDKWEHRACKLCMWLFDNFPNWRKLSSNNHFTTCDLLPLFENWNIKHWNYLMSTNTNTHIYTWANLIVVALPNFTSVITELYSSEWSLRPGNTAILLQQSPIGQENEQSDHQTGDKRVHKFIKFLRPILL